MTLTEFDPLPVPDIDLGQAAAAHPSGGVTTELAWSQLDDDRFERLLYDLLRGLPNYQNVQWLMKTRAPDRGRDLSLERVTRDAAGPVRTERVIVQAKHWRSKSISPLEIQQSLASLSMWEPPAIRNLIIITSGRFTTDAVSIAEKHNNDGKTPLLELWPDSQLEAMLARRPDLVEAHHLRRQA
ncbi:restriction endonuclease [Kribbella sp. CWNU-51]